MLCAFLIPKSVRKLCKRIRPVDDGTHSQLIALLHHVQLLATAADNEALQRLLLHHHLCCRNGALMTGHGANERNVSADPYPPAKAGALG